MEVQTLGNVIREMARRALSSEDRKFRAKVLDIVKITTGKGYSNLTYEEIKDYTKIPQLKSSYIYNTTARMPELQSANVRAKHKFEVLNEDMKQVSFDDGDKYLTIEIVDGAVDVKAGRKARSEQAELIVSAFKKRIFSVMPDLADYEGESLAAAVKAIKDYRSIIEGMK